MNIYADIFFVNLIDFMHTKSKNIEFSSVQHVKSHHMQKVINGINIVKRKYEQRGFVIDRWHVDNEFNTQKLRDAILPAGLETYGRKEHVGYIEQSIRVIKERARSTYADLPFKRLKKLMIQELFAGIVCALNNFPLQYRPPSAQQ